MSREALSLFFELFGPWYVSLEVLFVPFGFFPRTLCAQEKSLSCLQNRLFFHVFQKDDFCKLTLISTQKKIESWRYTGSWHMRFVETHEKSFWRALFAFANFNFFDVSNSVLTYGSPCTGWTISKYTIRDIEKIEVCESKKSSSKTFFVGFHKSHVSTSCVAPAFYLFLRRNKS